VKVILPEMTPLSIAATTVLAVHDDRSNDQAMMAARTTDAALLL
jgi:hypothetical protein